MDKNMSKPFRTTLFFLFLFAFLVSAPIVVLYTAGYRLDLTHGRIVHTAVLNLSSIPRHATVVIDGHPFADPTPAVIDTILPGEHLVSLTKDGYLPWETRLSFESRQARVVGPIVLFLDQDIALAESFMTIMVAPHTASNRFAYLTQESSWLEAWVIQASTGEKKLLMRLPFQAESAYQLLWSKDGTYLLLARKYGAVNELSLARVEDGTPIELSLKETGVETFWWDVNSDDQLYVKTQSNLSRITLATNESTLLTSEAEQVMSYDHRQIALTQTNDKAVLAYQEDETASIITYLPLGEYVFVEAPSPLIALHETVRNRLVLVNPHEQEQPILLNEEADLWTWNRSGDVLLYSSGYDVQQYVRALHQTETLTRVSQPITGMYWYPEGNVVIYQSDGDTIALTLEGGKALSQTILAPGLSGVFWIDQNGKELHLLRELANDEWEWWIKMLQE